MFRKSEFHSSNRRPDFIGRKIWINLPDSSDDPKNNPTHKPAQKFCFNKPWEPKHAIGKQHVKRMELESKYSCMVSYSLKEGLFGCFCIMGRPENVDKAMVELKEWLNLCKAMHQRDINEIRELLY